MIQCNATNRTYIANENVPQLHTKNIRLTKKKRKKPIDIKEEKPLDDSDARERNQ
jgi:hypothetical protein